MTYDGMSPAEVYEHGVVPGIFAEWTPALVAKGKPASGERVLDLACGTGVVSRAAAVAVGSAGSVVGVDVSPAMLEVARAAGVPDGGAPVEWRQGSADALPVADEAFDLVLCQQGLQFFPDKAGAAGEIARALRLGGRLALSVWSGLAQNPMQAAYNDSLLRSVGAAIFTAPFSFGDAAALESLLTGAGLESVRVEEETRLAHFATVEDFVEVHVIGAAAVIPEMAALDAEARAEVIRRSVEDLEPLAQRYFADGEFAFPMTALVATARK